MAFKVLVSVCLSPVLLLACQEKAKPTRGAALPLAVAADGADAAAERLDRSAPLSPGALAVETKDVTGEVADDGQAEGGATLAGAPARALKKREVDDGPRSVVVVVVRRGESMGLYGRWAKIAMRDLYRRAGLTWGDRLAAGRSLRIAMTAKEGARFEAGRAAFAKVREGAFAKAATETYTVRRGDSGWRIARRRGVPLDVLERLNPSADLKSLQVGDKLKVPSKGGES